MPDNFPKPFGELLVIGSIAEAGTEVMFGDAEEAGANFAVGGKANAVAVAAEWFADWSDNPDLAAAIGETPPF